MPGRKRTPTAVKKVKGTIRKDRLNANAPAPVDDLPAAPGYLKNELEYVAFDIILNRVAEIGVASATDTEMLALAAKNLAEVWACDAVIDSIGMLIPTDSGNGWRANPAVGIKGKAMRQLQSLLTEFGLSPAAREKVSTTTSKTSSNRFEKFKKGQ